MKAAGATFSKDNMRIYLDMDGVIANWVNGVMSAFNMKDVDEANFTNSRVDDYLGYSYRQFWDILNLKGESFWTGLKRYPWSDAVVDICHSFDPSFRFLTSPSESPLACSGKLKWLQAYYPEHANRYIFTKRKEDLSGPGRVLIDDSEHYEDDWAEAGGCFILFPRPWNRLRANADPNEMVFYLRAHLRAHDDRISGVKL